MDHGHMGHGGMDMPSEPMCSMNAAPAHLYEALSANLGLKMIFTWDTTNLCIIFKWWRITGLFSLLVSLAAVAGITALYELVREASRRYEARSQEYLNSLPMGDDDSPSGQGSLLWSGKGAGPSEQRARFAKAAFYAVQVFYSFFIMLLFMTYNGWVMLAVAVGAFIGYLGFGNSTSTKSVACH